MRPALEIRGQPASDGIFAGPLICVRQSLIARHHSGTAESEREALNTAIVDALRDLSALMALMEGEAADMIAFQAAMLEDDVLRAPAFEAISETITAHEAWSTVLDAEIAGYEQSEDDYFRARSADLKDIRDRVLRHLGGVSGMRSADAAILAGEDLPPTRFLETDWSRGGAILLGRGSLSSHVAMLARARGVPMIVGLGDVDFAAYREAIVDGTSGVALFYPAPETRKAYAARQEKLNATRERESDYLLREARLKDGRRIDLLINAASVEELARLDPRCCDGIGLMRSEFLFHDGAPLPDEEQQYHTYRRFLEWAGERPVTIRTLDIGGDKPVRGLSPAGEKNPFLGLRGVRLTLARPEVFCSQLRALARAAVHGNLKVMLPMVTAPQELDRAASFLDSCIRDLQRAAIPCRRPPLGIMVEVPAVAITPELFAKAEFFSIGSNDLTQYVTASSRDDPSVAHLNDPSHPAVLRLIAQVTSFGQAHGIPVSICGDMASEPRHLASLIAAGLTSLSIAPSRVARVKAALAEL